MEDELSKQSEDNIIIVRGKFKSEAINQYGLFLLIFNAMKNIDTHQVIVATFSEIYDLDLSSPWNKFEEYIVDRKWKGNYIHNITTSISDAFNRFPEDVKSMTRLYESVCNYDYEQMDIILYDIINRLIHDKNLKMETIIQEVSQQELQNIREDRSKPQKQDEETQDEETQDEKKDDGNVILKIKPVLAPLNGKPIYELRVGDKIMIKIIPASSKENYYIDLNNLRDEDKGIKSMPAKVIDIKSSASKNNPIEILTEIMPGVYGLCLEDEKLIKLKLYDSEVDALYKEADRLKPAKKTSSSNKKSKTSKSIVVMSMFLIFILLVFVILLMFGW
ncbi:MAG: DUF4899 domain-containing protein [Leptospirales bacterium]|nr:DUF4899 domain-containing protein [Leptospirales bacterium]